MYNATRPRKNQSAVSQTGARTGQSRQNTTQRSSTQLSATQKSALDLNDKDTRVLINEKRNGIRLTAIMKQSYKFRESIRLWVYTICMEKATALDSLREGSLTSVMARETGDINLWKECVEFEYEGPESDQLLIERARESIQKKRAIINDMFAL